jgi:glucose/arabinose dehydrogenase
MIRLTFFISLLLSMTVQGQELNLIPFATGFNAPLNIQNAGDQRLFIVEQGGRIKIVNSDGTTNATPFLDLSSLISSGGERGLLGLAFHPNYVTNGYFYVYYTNPNGNTQVSRFSVDAQNPDLADPNSQLALLSFTQPYANHNGGCIAFGPDGYLYIGSGDGGSGGDPENRAQNTTTLLGKILRIDVDQTSGGLNYAIPNDNPFAGSTTDAQEIWAYGIRNPWKFSFDSANGDLWIADVGQNAFEEINRVSSTESGLNYGWRCYEGNQTYNNSNCPPSNELTFPITIYPHNVGSSITGGYVYRGAQTPWLQGYYIFADFVSGIMGLVNPDNGVIEVTQNFSQNWSSFGVDIDQELYVSGFNGVIYKIEGVVLGAEDFGMSRVTLWPNPSNDSTTISATTSILSVIVYDSKGAQLATVTTNNDTTLELVTDQWANGWYVIQVITDKGQISHHKLLVQ